MNSLMEDDNSKCHIVNVTSACLAAVTWDITHAGQYCKANWQNDFTARTNKSLSDCQDSCVAQDPPCRSITHGTQTCSDTPSTWMTNNGKTCADDVDYSSKCKNSNGWVNNKYCQQSCFDAGQGYDGDDCAGANVCVLCHPKEADNNFDTLGDHAFTNDFSSAGCTGGCPGGNGFTGGSGLTSAALTSYTYNPSSDTCASLDELPSNYFVDLKGRERFGKLGFRSEGDPFGMPLPAGFKECIKGGSKHSTCSIKLCHGSFHFGLKWPMKMEFAGAYTASNQWYEVYRSSSRAAGTPWTPNDDPGEYEFDWD